VASTKTAVVVLVMVSPVAVDKDSKKSPLFIEYLSREMTSLEVRPLVTLTPNIKFSVFVSIIGTRPIFVLVRAGTPRLSEKVSSTAEVNVSLDSFSGDSPA
jgi:hypothetical protein